MHFLCTTISPALPYALFDTAVSGASEKDQYNGKIVFDGVVESAKTALANGIPVGLGNDVGCPYITQYDFWRELCYFHKYCGVSNRFALYTATLRNAQLAGVGDVTGSIEPGKSADFIVTKHDPLEDLRALQHLELVVCRGHVDQKAEPQAEQNGGCPAGPVPRIKLKKRSRDDRSFRLRFFVAADIHMLAITARMLCQLLLRAGRASVPCGGVLGAVPEETVFMAVSGTDGWKNTAVSLASHWAARCAACGSACRVRRSAPAR